MTIDNQFLFYQTVAGYNEDLNAGNIKNTSIVFILEDSTIRTHGHKFSGGGSTPVDNTITLTTPIYYLKFSNRDTEITEDTTGYSTITKLSGNSAKTRGTTSVTLNSTFLSMIVRTDELQLVGATTSNHELLDINSSFEITTTGSGNTIYVYRPVIAPSSLTLTLTFSVL